MRPSRSRRRTSVWGPVGVALCLSLVVAAPVAADEPDVSPLERVRAYIQPSVVLLTTKWTGYVYDDANTRYLNNDQPFSTEFQCSAFAVSPDGHLASAAHCFVYGDQVGAALKKQAATWAIENNYYDAKASTLNPDELVKDYRVLNVDGQEGIEPTAYVVWGVTSGGIEGGRRYPATIVEVQEFTEGNAALLKVEAKGLQTLLIADGAPEVGQRVISSGHPGFKPRVDNVSFAPTFKDGTIVSKEADGGNDIFELSKDVPAGMDGGPTVDLDHRVVGFNSYRYDQQTSTSEYDYARSTSQITQLLDAAGVENEQGPLGRAYEAGLAAYFKGDRGDAVESFREVLDKQPDNEMARQFLDRAEKLPEGSSLMWTLILGLPLLLLAGGAAFAVITVRRRRTATPTPGPDSAAGGVTPGRIFISYRQKDSAYSTSWLFDRLTERFGADQVFKDVDSIGLGDDFVEAITDAVGSCDVLLAVIGEEWLGVTNAEGARRLDDPDDFVRLEIEAALDRKVLLVPILIDGVEMPAARDLPPSIASLSRRQALQVSPHRFREDTDRLLAVVDQTLLNLRKKQEPGAHADAPLAEAIAATEAAPPTGGASEQ